jgi:hypothetical protein
MVGCICQMAGSALAKSSTTTSLTSSGNPSAYAQAVVFTATVSSGSGTPTGTVTFRDGSAVLGTGSLNASHKATYSSATLSVGAHSITAEYGGDSGFNGSTSAAVAQTVNKANQTITLGHLGTHTYGDPPITLSATVSSGLPVSFSLLSGPATLVGNILTITGSGTIKISASQTGDANYNAAPSVIKPFTVNGPSSLTVSGLAVNSKSYDGGTVATLNTSSATLVGVVAGDNVTIDISGATASFSDRNVGTAKTVTISGVTLAGPDAGKYTFTPPTAGTADITALPVSASIIAADKFYDGTASATLTGTNLSGALSGEDVTLNCDAASFSDDTVGSNKTVTAGVSLSGADSANYLLSSPTATTTASILSAAAPSISLTMNPDGCANVACAGPAGLTFCVQVTDGLSPANWTTIATNCLGSDGKCCWVDTDATNHSVRFYRTMVSN